MKKNKLRDNTGYWIRVIRKALSREVSFWPSYQTPTSLVLVDVRRKIKNQYSRNHYAAMRYDSYR